MNLRHGWQALISNLAVLILCGPALAQDRNPAMPDPGATPRHEDAQLHAVAFAGSRAGWAVGDQGVIWHTADGGETWSLQPSGTTCPLRGVCFLTDRVGWAVGGESAPFTHIGRGMVLFTSDGGQTWGPVAVDGLPRLRAVRFFSQEVGIVVGDASSAHPSGVLASEDGGLTWKDLPGKYSPGWRTADFLNPDVGVLAGVRGKLGLAVDGQIVEPRLGNLGMRGLRALQLQTNGNSWLVGDGGLAVTSEDSGLVWHAPAGPLPDTVRQTFDFQTVCCRGAKVWIAGSPGNVIWHSPDNGQTWTRQLTSQTLPISNLQFSTDLQGCAVGALGTILKTDDGGQTWAAVHGQGRRLAYLAIHPRGQQLSFNLITQLSGELGYRGAAHLLSREDIGPDGGIPDDADVRVEEASVIAGGATATTSWQFPLSVPGLDRNFDKLVADWNRRTEGKLAEIVLGQLVSQLRMWRPTVVILQQPAEVDAVTRLTNAAVLRAVEQAADPTRYPEQTANGLAPWKVERVFARLPPQSTGQVHIDPHQHLPRLHQTVQMAATAAYSRLFSEADLRPVREAYRLVWPTAEEDAAAAPPRDFFAGIHVAPGGPARRELLPIDEQTLTAELALAREQRNFSAYTDRFLTDPRHAGQLIAQLDEVVVKSPPAQAAIQMAQVAETYRLNGHWELAELTMVQLVEKYPDEPVSFRAMQWLMQSWGSAEMTWRKLKSAGIQTQRSTAASSEVVLARLEQVAARLQQQKEQYEANQIPTTLPETFGSKDPQSQEAIVEKRERKVMEPKIRFWSEQSLKLAETLEQKAPELYASPLVQFPLASLHRKRSDPGRSDEVYRKYTGGNTEPIWSQAAALELWMTNPANLPPRPVEVCRMTNERPVLDGLLSDACWEDANEIPLTRSADEPVDGTRHALTMMCYDNEYLYFAASFPREPGTRTDGPTKEGRRYDEDLEDFDRVTLLLDIDRDYVTYYSFSVDQRGCTAETCWQDRQWNPRWLVAVDSDDTHWRLEIAIPFAELSPGKPGAEAHWGVGIIRTIPAVAVQSWTHPATRQPRPETFGLLRFD